MLNKMLNVRITALYKCMFTRAHTDIELLCIEFCYIPHLCSLETVSNIQSKIYIACSISADVIEFLQLLLNSRVHSI